MEVFQAQGPHQLKGRQSSVTPNLHTHPHINLSGSVETILIELHLCDCFCLCFDGLKKTYCGMWSKKLLHNDQMTLVETLHKQGIV